MVNFVSRFENTVKECWNEPAIGEYGGEMRTYGEFAKDIDILRFVCEASGLKPGDKIAINAKNCYEWSLIFMAVTMLGYTSVLILYGSTPETVQLTTRVSGSKILFTEKETFDGMNFEAMPELLGVVDLHSMRLLAARQDRSGLFVLRERLYNFKHQGGFHPEDVSYAERPMNSLCCIIYTSGSTGNPKGVRLRGQNFQNYVDRIPEMFEMQRGTAILNTLPFAHLFGLAYDMLAPLCLGMSVTILCTPPSPTVLQGAFAAVKPSVVFAVPMVLTKFVNKVIGKDISSDEGRICLDDIDNHKDWRDAVREKLNVAFGGKVTRIMSAGAASSLDMEDILVSKLGIPYVTGYGLTECAPLITLSTLDSYRRGSCGKVLPDIEFRIKSSDPHTVPGEILVKSKFIFAGYHNNLEATTKAFTYNGWFKTGDIGTIDEQGHVFLSGRCKNMLLTSNGQNVYPEEIEAILNRLPYVSESLIVQRKETFGALVRLDQSAEELTEEQKKSIVEQDIDMLNAKLPSYSKISWYEVESQDFSKTPKGSIRRFLYQERVSNNCKLELQHNI